MSGDTDARNAARRELGLVVVESRDEERHDLEPETRSCSLRSFEDGAAAAELAIRRSSNAFRSIL